MPVILALGCQDRAPAPPPTPPVRSGEPIGLQVQRVDPDLKGEPFRVLLDFETDADMAFISGDAGARLDARAAHTGTGSLYLPASTRKFAVKLGPLVEGQPFPGSWLLAGAYFYSDEAARVTVSYVCPARPMAGVPAPTPARTVTLLPKQWTPVMVDLSPLCDPNAHLDGEAGLLEFAVTGARAPLWCDDVIVADNLRYLVDAPISGDGWTVQRHGLATTLDSPGQFKLNVSTPDVGREGWKLEEASALRTVFKSRDAMHWWTIYADGRQYRDAQFASLIPWDPLNPAIARQHAFPAELSVPNEMGRVDRNNPADRNNDGYAEMTGSYELLAADQPRFEVTLTPHTPELVRPVLDVSGLPSGKVLVSMEGQLVESTVRLADGRLLVQLPGVIERPITVNFRVQ